MFQVFYFLVYLEQNAANISNLIVQNSTIGDNVRNE